MKKILLAVLLLILHQNLMATQSILKLDTKGHTSMIKDIIVSKSGDILSASDDKTIRVWDSKTGKEKRKILGQIGAGPQGRIYAIALSPNEEFLAVGGFLGKEYGISYDLVGSIRIYNYKTGKLLKTLLSHINVVFDLAFSSDGKYLISGSGDSTAKIWNVSNFALIDTIKFHTNSLYAVGILKKDNQYFAITAGTDKQIALYDMQNKELIKSDKKKYKLDSLAISEQHIAVSGSDSGEIQIYDHVLNPIKTIFSETRISGLSYSPNGKFLIAGTSTSPFNVNIYSVEEQYKNSSSFQKHKNTSKAVAFLDNQTAISGGGNNKEIYLWDRDSSRVKRKIEGVGSSVWSVALRSNNIAWGNKSNYENHNNRGEIQKTLNLKTFKVEEKVNREKLSRISTIKVDYQLSHRKGGNYGISDAILELQKDGRVEASIRRDGTNGYAHRCYGFYKNYIISGGSNGHLKIYNFQGKEVADLVGHTGEVWSIALDGDRLVSGSSDQTIKIWNLSKLEVNSEKFKINEKSLDQGMKQLSLTREQTIKYAKENNINIYLTPEIHPALNLFISKDNEWIVLSKNGYFHASIEGSKFIGYHINQGANKEAYFVESGKYYDKLHRPDIIEYIVQGYSEKEAIAVASTKQRVEEVDVSTSLPPILSLRGRSRFSTAKSSTTIKFKIESQSKIEKLVITRNGEQIQTRGLDRVTINLEDGENIIAIHAKNEFAMSDALYVRVTKTSNSENIYKPTLYLLSIGVSKYNEKSVNNLQVADKDAISVADMFQKQEGGIYKKVVIKQLIDSNASTDNILKALNWIEKETTQRDIAIIFIAGHGLNDDKGNYYFLAYDSHSDELRRTAIRWIEIKDTITSLPSKVILLADTCHSGNIMGQGIKRDITSAIKSIINSGTGSIIMTASTGRGYSIEKTSWGHGAFTKALLEGLDEAKADYDNNEEISIKEIDLYITNRVKELTDGRQKPTTIIPQSVPDFALGVLKKEGNSSSL